MKLNTLQPVLLIVLPTFLVVLVGCTPIKPAQSSAPHPESIQQTLQTDSPVPQAMAGVARRAIYQKSAANRSAISVQTGRYSSLAALPSPAQIYPLDVIIDVMIPEDCVTLEQAIRFLLRRSGYMLDPHLHADVAELLAKPLPAVHRKMGPIALKDALTLLVTPGFVVRQEPIKRIIRYSLIDEKRGGR